MNLMGVSIKDLLECSNNLKKTDKEFQDILHQIELLDLDAIALSKKVKRIRELTRERRIYKECASLLQTLTKGTDPASAVKLLTEAIHRSEKRISGYVDESKKTFTGD